MADDKTMTVVELIAELQKMPLDAKVWTEGCDCLGNVVAVSINNAGEVLIERDN